MKKQPHTIGCRVDANELATIDGIIAQTGQTRAQWLYALVHREMTGTDHTTVKGLVTRIAAMEQRLSRLFK